MRNTLEDLNNYLFESIERLNDDDLTDEQLDRELKRADGVAKVAGQIIQNAELAYKTMVHMTNFGIIKPGENTPKMLETHKEGDK